MAKKRTKKPSSTKKSKTALKPQGKASRRKAVDIPVDPAIATPQASNQAVGPIGAVEPTPEQDETAKHPRKFDPNTEFITMQFAGPVATADELRQYWTLYIANIHIDDNLRLKASELLGKSLAMFTDVHAGKLKVELELTFGTSNLGKQHG